MKNRMVWAVLMMGTAFLNFGCNESQEVELGPQTNSRIQKGEDAQKKLSRQTQLDSEVQKLEEQMENWIEKASNTKQPPAHGKLTVFGFVRSETDCSLRVESTYVDNRTFAEALQGMARAYPNCKDIVVVAERVYIPATQTLSSAGRKLTLIADVIDLDGTISTEGIPVGANENGKPGGDLNIYTLALRSGPGARLITKGSNAGAFRYEPIQVSEAKVTELRAQAEKNGITLKKKVKSSKYIDTNTLQPNAKLGEAFLSMADSAQEYLRNLHPGYNGKAPNPFRKSTRVIKIDSRAYYWKIEEEKIEVTPEANQRLSIEVPQIDKDYFREGGEAGTLNVRVATEITTKEPTIESHAGTDAIESLPTYAEWAVEALDDPIPVRHKDLVRYTFELWKTSSAKVQKMKSWSVTRADTSDVEKVKPRIKLQTRVIDRKESRPESGTNTNSVEKFVFTSGDASFINELMESDGLESNNLPDGIKNLKAWQKDWTDLESRAKQLGLTVKRKPK
jgi:hypothetical protein